MLYIGNDIYWTLSTNTTYYYRVRNKANNTIIYYGKATPINGKINVLLNDIIRSLFSTEVRGANVTYYDAKESLALNDTIVNIDIEYSTDSTFTTYSNDGVKTIANAYPFFSNADSYITDNDNVHIYSDFADIYGSDKISVDSFEDYRTATFDLTINFPKKFVKMNGQATYSTGVLIQVQFLNSSNTVLDSETLFNNSGNDTNFTTFQSSLNLNYLSTEYGTLTAWAKTRIMVSGTYYNGSTSTATTFATLEIPLGKTGKTACVADYYLFAIDNLGRQLQLPLYGHNKHKRSYTKSTYKTGYQTETVYKNEIKESIDVNTNWITESKANTYENLFASNKLVLKETASNRIFDVTNTTNSWTEYKYLSDKKLYNISLTLDINRKLLQQY